MNARLLLILPLACAVSLFAVRADGPGDNIPDKVRPIPPEGLKLDQKTRDDLQAKLDELGKTLAALPAQLKGKLALLDLIPDVEVFHKAVRYALEMNEFHAPADVKRALSHLATGLERARELRQGKPSWPHQTGLVVRGFRSRIDGSVQPYGLVVPASFRENTPHRHRLDIWLHGRGEKSSEVNFIDERQKSGGQFTPRNAFVLHPYGRYCNAFKFAGEVDVLEALEHVQKHYPIDEDRVVLRGFSMGGAGCWQMAVHFPSRWCAAAPGAGFSETPEFLSSFQSEKLNPPPYERTLWRMHDCDGWAANLFNLPTVAYSGEKDIQKQAADVMVEALKKENIALVHIIGKGAGHSYTPDARREIDKRIDRLAKLGRDRVPPRVRFTTYTVRYNQSHWVRVDGLTKHWEQSSVDASIVRDRNEITVSTKNVNALSLVFPSGDYPFAFADKSSIVLDSSTFAVPGVRSDRSLTVSFHRDEKGAWKLGAATGDGLRKRHGLQGPIDDAFYERFVFVRPTGKAQNEKVGAWVKSEMERAIRDWRRHFRGDAIVKDDTQLTDADLASSNVVLWGDPSSNKVLAKLAGKLPIAWDAKSVTLGKQSFPAATHAPILIYPNPLSPSRYVVLNSGFTYREYDYLNNARQTPKLPDYAIVDVETPPSTRWPGKVVKAGFFEERWRLGE